MKQNELNKIASVNHDIMEKLSLNCSALCTVEFDIVKNEWRQTSTDPRFIPEIIEKRLDVEGAPLLKEKQGDLDQLHGFSFEEEIYGTRTDFQTIITKMTPQGYQEVIITTPHQLTEGELLTLDRSFHQIHTFVNQGVKDIIFPQIRALDTIMKLHDEQTSKILDVKDELDGGKPCFTFGNLVFSKNEMILIRGQILGQKPDQFDEFTRKAHWSIRSKLLKKTDTPNMVECMKVLNSYGVIRWLSDYFI